VIPLIQIAGIFGVWGVSALAVFPSAFFAAAWNFRKKGGRFLRFARREKIPAFAWILALSAALVYGFTLPKDFSQAPKARLALIQHNTDPWKPSKAPSSWQALEEYRTDFTILRRLSDEALASEPKPDMVVWSETAFVPRIYWHETYRDDPASWALVKELLDYLAAQDLPFVIGNDDARKDPAKNPDRLSDYRVDYNAVMLFEKGRMSQIYRKLHLVPFTEHFPYEKQLPLVYRALEKADTHFWEKGKEATVFKGPGFSFSSPICFEDTFGYLSREFVRRGAELIVNLSNDAWSRSLPAQNQHLSMAVFRAVENRRSMARSTASGQTCAVDPSGRLIALAPPFEEAWITVELPLVKSDTIYTRYGDFLGIAFAWAGLGLLLFGGVLCILGKNKKRSP
jgi:apolipoprotein N-acyltransferase